MAIPQILAVIPDIKQACSGDSDEIRQKTVDPLSSYYWPQRGSENMTLQQPEIRP